ncbi:uroporphyrinogen-III synthase [Bordetella sp. 15P40C-2]|uniref:uroporphyrinogen-III synthase n=1 Tax=Bordetella sp. 15P40C-2 TaxID=2572246 RepID=UPI00132C6D69|nr:uroporphyrinogen-III synthase [Bordetella sp. 15P40C-2]MVW72180.1 uroporphyrinogen-III synthase [Bordetella sp. 15P40C-2]
MPQIAILTRPEGRNDVLADGLRQAGWQVLALPALSLRPLPVPAGELPLPEQFDLVVFVSGYAAQVYFRQWREATGQARWPANVPAATVGPASATAVREQPGFGADTTVFCPPPDAQAHDSEALWELLRAQTRLPERVLIVRGTRGRDWLAQQLEASGVRVRIHAAYERQQAEWPATVIQQLHIWARHSQKVTWLLTSGEGLVAILSQIRASALEDWWQNCDFVVTHPKLAQQLKEGGGTGPNAMVKTCLPADDAILAAFVAA